MRKEQKTNYNPYEELQRDLSRHNVVNRPVWHLNPQTSEVIKKIKLTGRIKI